VRQVEPRAGELAQVGLDDPLVLRGRGDDLRVGDRAVRGDPVPVVEQPARCLCAAVPGRLRRRHVDPRRVRRLVVLDEPQRLLARVDQFDGADDDAAERVGAGGTQPSGAGRGRRRLRQVPGIQAVPGHRADQVGPVPGQHRVQRRGVRHLELGKVPVVVPGLDVQTAAGDDPVAHDRVPGGVAQRDELVVGAELREAERRHPADRVQRRLAGPLQLAGEPAQITGVRGAVEAADPDVDRVHRAPADHLHQPVTRLLHAQAPFQDLRVVAGHVDAALVAEEVGRVQQVDVQHVALDPFAAVQQPAQRVHRLGHRDSAGVLDGPARAHLVGDRADPADPRGDVRRLGVPAAAQQALEEPGRLVDVQPGLGDAAVLGHDLQPALALDPGQPGHPNVCHAPPPPCGTVPRPR
jgi:hypothetical protein